MRLSIWQQFSSNHSANFEIVGTFKTEELAHQAAEELREISRAIAQIGKRMRNTVTTVCPRRLKLRCVKNTRPCGETRLLTGWC